MPKRTRAADVQAFVESHYEWIRSAREQFAAVHAPQPFALPTTIKLPALERQFMVDYRPDAGAKTVKYRSHGDTLILYGHTTDEAMCVAALQRWMIGLAKKEYLPRLQSLSRLTANTFKKMHVRGQRTCWGSHSSSGTLSLNYCLMFLSAEHLRYVMIHELCHARHMNHSRRFWNHVGEFEPDYKRLDRDLNDSWAQIPTWVGIY